MSETLKRCPFCGGKAEYCSEELEEGQQDDDGFWYAIMCSMGAQCGVQPKTQLCPTPEMAAREWNNRRPEEGR